VRISAQNRLAGTIVDMKRGKATTHVRIRTEGEELTVVVTSSAVEQMALEVGDAVGATFREVDVLLMKGTASLSAGNRFRGRVLDIKRGTVTAEVPLDVGGRRLVAVVARAGAEAMGLAVGDEVTAFVREIDVLLIKGEPPMISARNRVAGTLTALRPGTVTTELTVDAGGGWQVLALLARTAADAMALAPGDRVTTLVREGDVMVMTE
jgi:molybdate transport system regulatory protein